MRFFVLKEELDFDLSKLQGFLPQLSSGVSVDSYRRWLLRCLRRFGPIVPLSKEDLTEKRLSSYLKKEGAILVTISLFPDVVGWEKIARRQLILSLGNLLVPEGLFHSRLLPSAQALLVSTNFQVRCLQRYLGKSIGYLAVFPPFIDTEFYRPPSHKEKNLARKRFGVAQDEFHIVFAGRWIVTKGVYQLIRCLDKWPLKNMKVSLTAELIPDEKKAGLSRQQEFILFMDKEVFRKRRTWLKINQARRDKKFLRELFWSADIFVNPSVHPDENYGITPREALACGVPCLTTNFCGLRPMADMMPWQGLDSYPTPVGLRFSLGALRDKLVEVKNSYRSYSAGYFRQLFLKEYSPDTAVKELEKALRYLVLQPAQLPLVPQKAISGIQKELLSNLDPEMLRFLLKTSKELAEPVLFYGNQPFDYNILAVQSIYAASAVPPKIQKGQVLGGFFRIELWPQEKLLVEFASPHPRHKVFTTKDWQILLSCGHKVGGEYIFIPQTEAQLGLLQELVDTGYLVGF